MIRNQKGFTLLEVLIVVAIIIIIAGIALPRFLGVSEQGKEARARGDLRVLQTAIESYVLNTNTIPANAAALQTALETATPNIVSDYASFKDPFSANAAAAYNYASATSTDGKKYYVFWSIGKDGAGTISGISNTGVISGSLGDDVFVTNGKRP